jgi:hypothetical protein
MFPSDRMVKLYPEAHGSLAVAFYDTQSYGGGIVSRLRMESIIIHFSAFRT